MAIGTESEAIDVAKQLLAVRRDECKRLDLIRSYIRGNENRVFLPNRAGREHRELVEMSLTNIMPLVVSTFAQNLFIEGFRARRKSQNAKSWALWQANRMDARQSGLFRSAVEYGLAYSTVLPGKIDGERSALMSLYSPRMLTAVYDDPIGDEWPVYALAVRQGYDKDSGKYVRRLVLLDEKHFINMVAAVDSDEIKSVTTEGDIEHGLTVTPVVRWLAAGGNLDDQSRGEVEPLMRPQDSLNQTTFGLRKTERDQGFPQRFATGVEEELDENNNPVEPFQGGSDRYVVNSSADASFGQFPAASPDGYLNSRQSTLRIITAIAQMAPHALLVSDGITNLSAEALAALENAQQRKIGEYKTSLGESAEQMLRLASKAAGDDQGWQERSAQVVWRDTESRSLAQVADALGKLAQMLSIPPKAMWEMAVDLLHYTQEDLERWVKYADEETGLSEAATQEAIAREELNAATRRIAPLADETAEAPDVVPAGTTGTARPPRARRSPVAAGADR